VALSGEHFIDRMRNGSSASHGILLDTHSLIWLQFGRLTARPEVFAALRTAADERNWFVSSFSFYEIAHAVQRGRLQLDLPVLDWLRKASTHRSPRVLGITPEIASATSALPASFHGDPGDRIIAATAIAENLTLCTHDDILLRFGKQGLFRTLKVRETKE
jgi:PIN domain nuclease of toxin-antitoxin system